MNTGSAVSSPYSLSNVSLTSAASGLAFAVILVSSFIDILGGVRIGDFSAQAFVTTAYLFSGFLLLSTIPSHTFIPGRSICFVVFLFWGYTSLLWSPARVAGLQNLMVISTLLVMTLVAQGLATLQPSFALDINRYLKTGILIATVLYAGATLWYGSGTNDLFGARTFSLFALFGVAQNLADWRYGKRMGLLWAAVITILIGVSQSRFSLGIAVSMFPLAQFPAQIGRAHV